MTTLPNAFYNSLDQLSPEVAPHRQPETGVSPLFPNRWSSRAFDQRRVPDEVLNAVLEAARWAPSASNQQPWRFIVARTEEQRQAFASFIKPGNRQWTDHAPVLVLVASSKVKADGEPNGQHAFDTGAAWGALALQAHLLGLNTRAVGGFERPLAREVLNVPEEIELHAVIALGYKGSKDYLPADLQERDVPNGRRPLAESLIEGKFPSQEGAEG
ncbi:nitroreductase family protein [Paenibacillus sp. S-38]|uniref:nitroreductase family protein n=1 Tax=Paenibacillus sp. S-38 TaxID=3416710 RepID=UPI003CF85E7F